MAFSVNLLTTPAQCDVLLATKQRERTGLVNRLNNLNYQLDNWDDASSAEAELASTQALIAGLTPVVAALADGDDKRRNQNMLNRYETRANNLTGRVENYGVTALLEKELDRDGITSDIVVLDGFIAAVTARKAQL
ncbi:hypothetical protein LGH70_06535 [Hymenobacter sp. BT635]|uniref:Uncharacterized protein n=1 Tax=Hymenobacter nitidus TaxID=2880929 RepID=A0ABS8AA02_9BACT|nr:hypothetical protein [Hymenobacter nitidus]MCB2377231.1 hypothetical protein [Hymenobacter nitidus]